MSWKQIPEGHPAVVKAMRLYDEIFDDTEKRNIFQSTIRAVVGAKTGAEGDPMADLADGMAVSVAAHSDPKIHAAIRESRDRPKPRYEDCVDVAEIIADLRRGDAA